MYLFFFKQKTAYEMRISDWSSDVCSSDLGDQRVGQQLQQPVVGVEHVQALPRHAAGAGHAVRQRGRAFARHRGHAGRSARSEGRRVGKEGVSTRRSRWSPEHSKKKQKSVPYAEQYITNSSHKSNKP